MSRLRALAAACLAATAVVSGPLSHPLQAQAQRSSQAADPAGPPSRALLDRYCVTCHNEQLRTGGVTFDTIDIGRVDLHRELFEKVVRKLRNGQMPPAGRPRPEPPAVTAFVAALETELDRVNATAPDPGRVASHRLNRTEYVHVIEDLLALEIDGEALLPSDMAGFGFDNNADVLAMTPALMDRYITAATKVSRLAVGTLENRPMMQTYRVPTGARQDARMSEDLPFATHGGLAVRHAFSLDGDYLFRLRLQRTGIGESILGNIAERSYDLELRIDHELVGRLSVGGQFEGQVKYTLTAGGIAPPDDDLVQQQIALYNQNADEDLEQNADEDLEIRLPVRAGTRLVSRDLYRCRAVGLAGRRGQCGGRVVVTRDPRTVRRGGPGGHAKSPADLRVSAHRSRRRRTVRPRDSQHADAPRLSTADYRRRPRPADGDLRARTLGRRLRDGDRAGAGSAAEHACVSAPCRSPIRPARRTERSTASATSSWHHGWPLSYGGACRTTSFWP